MRETGSSSPPPHNADGAPIDRRAALAQGAPKVPDNFVFWLLGAVLVLSVGGLLGEHVLSSVGLNPTPTTTTTTTAPPVAPSDAATPPTAARALGSPLAALMGARTLAPRRAPAFTLGDLTGQPTSVPDPPQVVVLTFFDASCNDICPVLASEIEQADADLGARADQVEFVTVNTEPAGLSAAAADPVLEQTHLGSLANWRMLTGSLSALDAVWKDYGVSISVAAKTGQEAHNDVMDFIDARGQLRIRATPFADESSNGSFHLPATTVARWARGIAVYAMDILEPTTR